MQKIKAKNILIGAVIIIVVLILGLKIIGVKFKWQDRDLPGYENMNFVATCVYFGIWHEPWGIRQAFTQKCSNI